MSTANNIELLIITIVLSVFFVSCLVLIVQFIRIMAKIKKIAHKAELVIDNVESASKTILNFSSAAHGRFRLLHLIQNLMDMSGKKDK